MVIFYWKNHPDIKKIASREKQSKLKLGVVVILVTVFFALVFVRPHSLWLFIFLVIPILFVLFLTKLIKNPYPKNFKLLLGGGAAMNGLCWLAIGYEMSQIVNYAI